MNEGAASSRGVTKAIPEVRTSHNQVSRRALLFGSGAAIGAIGATTVHAVSELEPPHLDPATLASPVSANVVPVKAMGVYQAGVARPAAPQQHCVVVVADLDLATLEGTLQKLGEVILELTSTANVDHESVPDGPGDLTITVGLGPRALAESRHPVLARSVQLPQFAGDAALPDSHRDGDLYLSVNATDAGALEPALARLTAAVTGYRERWSDFGFRAASTDDVSRNPLGYHDGVIVPRTRDELSESVWVHSGPLAGGTICVIRRFALDTSGFRELSAVDRDAVIGREQLSGAPLSGGSRDDQVNLTAKNDAGELLVPLRSHARAAHPSFTGSDLMLRRSYAYRASASDHGLLFIAFQNDIDTFIRTQLRLDEVDDLMTFATPTATGAFAILPGFTEGTPLGYTLF